MAGYYLLIDAGNTRIKWARVEEGQLIPGLPVPIRPAVLPAIEAVWSGFERPLGVGLSNVAGERVEADLISFIKRRWCMDPLIVKTQHQGFGVTSGYRNPERLGVDRWLALIAGRKRSKQPTVIVDAGSACTIDLLDSEGRHLGGYILPGLTAMGDALVKGTHQIQESKIVSESSIAPGLDTQEGVASGSVLALAGAIERALYDFETKGLGQPVLIITGGDAVKLAAFVRYPTLIAHDLVLEGLWLFLQESR